MASLLLLFRFYHFTVAFCIKQISQGNLIGELDLKQPAFTKGVVIHRLWRIGQHGVGLNHFTGDRTVDIGGRLDRLDNGALDTCG